MRLTTHGSVVQRVKIYAYTIHNEQMALYLQFCTFA